jgi:hypothetical protein
VAWLELANDCGGKDCNTVDSYGGATGHGAAG